MIPLLDRLDKRAKYPAYHPDGPTFAEAAQRIRDLERELQATRTLLAHSTEKVADLQKEVARLTEALEKERNEWQWTWEAS